jgi:DNA-binding transcriptional ArsR family regulator
MHSLMYALTDIYTCRHTYGVAASATIEVLAEPSRRRILDALLEGEQPVHALVERLDISQPAVSKHLRVLRDAGLVAVRPDGQRRLYRLLPQSLIELDEWLSPYRQMWRTSLDKLEDHLAEGGSRSGG